VIHVVLVWQIAYNLVQVLLATRRRNEDTPLSIRLCFRLNYETPELQQLQNERNHESLSFQNRRMWIDILDAEYRLT
jgi:hypothetical protein